MPQLKNAELPFLAFMDYDTKKGRFTDEEVEIRRVFEDANDNYVTFFSKRLNKEITIPWWNVYLITDEYDVTYETEELFETLAEKTGAAPTIDSSADLPQKSRTGIGRTAKILAAACAIALGVFFELNEPSSVEERLLILLVAWITIYIPVWVAVWIARRGRNVFQRTNHSG